jgi:hypothetical protein
MNKTKEKVDELKGIFEATEVRDLERLQYSLADAIREGSMVSEQADGWGDGESMCAMHAAVAAAAARGYVNLD